MKRIKWLFSLGLVMALLVGCAQVFPTAQVSELPTEAPTEVTLPTDIPALPTDAPPEASEDPPPTAEDPTEEVQAESPTQTGAEPTTAPATDSPSGDPTEVPSSTTQLGSPELHATNPSTVQLASGKVQLVEFFAFW